MKIPVPKEVLAGVIPVRAGIYPCQIVSEKLCIKNDTAIGVFMECSILEGEYTGRKLTKFISTTETALGFMVDFAINCGYPIEKIDDKFDTTKLIGLKFLACVSDDSKYKDSVSSYASIA